ncbi:MAG: helix-turn-helix domain-containing protein [Desulfosarcina sp.]|nr:helix-turn-helix domain-containing protein [Desulfosarcina sp.]MBC2744149.1 helix-turn-helix domain-containing protein [Desulfosarcina sp.]MBC2767058.1 helix-turn-helix domain-containing protein [Desulfosarcina sp.]
MAEISKFDWQRMISSEKGPKSPTTRHVLLTLSLYMNDDGGSCYPSTKKLGLATGLSERSVCTHLDIATSAGWIRKHIKTGEGRAWKLHSYTPATPDKALKEVQQQGTEGGSAALTEGTEPHTEGAEPHDIKALKEVQSTIHNTIHNDARSFLLKGGSTFTVNDEFYQILKESFPNVDVDGELKKITAWCYSNESKRKTRKGAKRFINGWLQNAKPANTPTAIIAQVKEFDFENQFHEE